MIQTFNPSAEQPSVTSELLGAFLLPVDLMEDVFIAGLFSVVLWSSPSVLLAVHEPEGFTCVLPMPLGQYAGFLTDNSLLYTALFWCSALESVVPRIIIPPFEQEGPKIHDKILSDGLPTSFLWLT